jgi:hypothetical protein
MNCAAPASARPELAELFRSGDLHTRRLGVAVIIALATHTLGGLYANSRPAPAALRPPPVEVELSMHPPPAPPEPPPQVEPELKPVATPAAAVKLSRAPAPPPAAKAGAALTATETPAEPESTEPFDFTSDPRSAVYGGGVVAVGGTAAFGEKGAQAGGRGVAPVAPGPIGDALTAAGDLSERPRLQDSDPCRGYFPKAALSDVASATVRVVIAKGGNVTRADVVSEAPKAQGFGAAARTCLLAQRFSPALDRDGRRVATGLNVNVKFKR